MKQFSCDDAKQIDLVEYMASLNYHPTRIRNADYWYLSPLRSEKIASFKVDRNKNVWYDHGTGKGGDIIDFGTLYHNCSIQELLKKLSTFKSIPSLSFGSPGFLGSEPGASPRFAGEKKETTDSKIVVIESRPLAAQHLLDYLKKRYIPLEIAGKYCREVDFLLYGKPHTVIGFPNNSGGYELRNENFKGSSSPKEISLIDNKIENLVVFEGFFSFLSFATINKNQSAPLTNCLILNSLSFFEKSRQVMGNYNQVHLLLDRDNRGIECTKQALSWHPDKYIDRSDFYKGRKDLNEWLIHHNKSLQIKQSSGHKRFP
ncbi:MAG: toprim domain-containing protein [Chitinophagaceae bacterium]